MFRSCWVSSARCSKMWSIQLVDWYSQTHYMQMVITSDETQIQIFANWPRSHVKRLTSDNRKSLEYRVVAAIRKLRTDTNCPAGKWWPNHVKNEQHIGSEKTYGPKNTEKLKIMMQRTTNENFLLQSFASLCSTVQYFWGRRSFQIRCAAHF